jgi:hypothetical protein
MGVFSAFRLMPMMSTSEENAHINQKLKKKLN